MLMKKRAGQKMCDVNYYTARRLEDMAESLGRLARAFENENLGGAALTREEGLAAMQTSGALVCGDCSRCSLAQESEKEDNYYLYYLLRTFEQKGRIEAGDMPQVFLTPHVSGGYHLSVTLDNVVDICVGNLGRYLAGESLKNLVQVRE